MSTMRFCAIPVLVVVSFCPPLRECISNQVASRCCEYWIPVCGQYDPPEHGAADMTSVLYTADVSEHFFVRIRIHAMDGDSVYVDFRDYWNLLRPIQWAVSDELRLTEINIRTQVPPELTDEYMEEIISAWEAGQLQLFPEEGFIEYYVDFNAGSCEDLLDLSEDYLHIAIGGWLTITDGERVEIISPDDGFIFNCIELPVSFREVPRGAVIAYDSDLGVVIEEY